MLSENQQLECLKFSTKPGYLNIYTCLNPKMSLVKFQCQVKSSLFSQNLFVLAFQVSVVINHYCIQNLCIAARFISVFIIFSSILNLHIVFFVMLLCYCFFLHLMLLIFVNHPKKLTQESSNFLPKNITLLKQNKRVELTLGCNQGCNQDSNNVFNS